ncbi:MAG: ATP-binding cassette domain-containing protein, partial [Nitrospinae bacterium]|nr:ATP-binding cassette domain-containing protein [Nitrospinota bacterium]
TIADVCAMPVSELREYFEAPPLTPDQRARASDVLKQVRERLDFLHKVGLEYLTLDRETRTLSGGEHQRINLANQLGAHLTGTLYILDEPTIGLHPRDNARLVSILKDLVDRGNTLLVVEHDRDVIDEADYVVDLGPGAGERGGEVVFSGPREELDLCERSATAKFLSGEREISPRKIKRGDNGSCSYLSLLGAQANNLKKVDLHVPLGRLV